MQTTVTVTVVGTQPGQVRATAVFKFDAGDDHGQRSLDLAAVIKVPFVQLVGSPALNFGVLEPGARKTLSVTLSNPGLVDAAFELDAGDVVSPALSVSPTSGTVRANGGQQQLQVTYTAPAPGDETHESYLVRVSHGNTLRLDCVANAARPRVTLSGR